MFVYRTDVFVCNEYKYFGKTYKLARLFVLSGNVNASRTYGFQKYIFRELAN